MPMRTGIVESKRLTMYWSITTLNRWFYLAGWQRSKVFTWAHIRLISYSELTNVKETHAPARGSSKEKAILAIHPLSLKRGILTISRKGLGPFLE
jgi:hypothetical protein